MFLDVSQDEQNDSHLCTNVKVVDPGNIYNNLHQRPTTWVLQLKWIIHAMPNVPYWKRVDGNDTKHQWSSETTWNIDSLLYRNRCATAQWTSETTLNLAKMCNRSDRVPHQYRLNTILILATVHKCTCCISRHMCQGRHKYWKHVELALTPGNDTHLSAPS